MCGSANRALGSIITKMIKNSGFPLNVYSKLYDTCVCSVSDYGAEVLGYHEYVALERLHLRAIRAFLGLPRNTPAVGLKLELDWMEPRSRTQIKMIRLYHRLTVMPDTRLTKKVFLWDLSLASQAGGIPTWSGEVKDILHRNNMIGTFSLNPFNLKLVITELEDSLKQKDISKLQAQITKTPKLRTYIHISGEDVPKSYLVKPLSFAQKKLVAKTRLGILPLRLETGRYERPPLAASERLCSQCDLGEVESEEHFILICPKHSYRRTILFSNIENLADFNEKNNMDKLKFLLNDASIVKASSQFIMDSFAASTT